MFFGWLLLVLQPVHHPPLLKGNWQCEATEQSSVLWKGTVEGFSASSELMRTALDQLSICDRLGIRMCWEIGLNSCDLFINHMIVSANRVQWSHKNKNEKFCHLPVPQVI